MTSRMFKNPVAIQIDLPCIYLLSCAGEHIYGHV